MSEITDVILEQLGGLRLLRIMLGTERVLIGENCIDFGVKGCRKINKIKIEYVDGLDLYRVHFFHYSPAKTELKLVSDHSKIYCDQLVELIESQTGLCLRKIRLYAA